MPLNKGKRVSFEKDIADINQETLTTRYHKSEVTILQLVLLPDRMHPKHQTTKRLKESAINIASANCSSIRIITYIQLYFASFLSVHSNKLDYQSTKGKNITIRCRT